MGAHAVMGPGAICYCMDCIAIGDYAVSVSYNPLTLPPNYTV